MNIIKLLRWYLTNIREDDQHLTTIYNSSAEVITRAMSSPHQSILKRIGIYSHLQAFSIVYSSLVMT